MPLRTVPSRLHTVLAAAVLGASACQGVPPGPTLDPGASYFSIDGTQRFLALRNIYGRTVEETKALLDQASLQGTKLVRFHVNGGALSTGAIDEAWAVAWEEIFDRAAADGMYVVPVFGVWADWNDGSGGELWHTWHLNPLNTANGGPASAPSQLYVADSDGQRAYLGWVSAVVARWKARTHIAAWEVFSELDLVTHTGDAGAFQTGGIDFVRRAREVIRAADPLLRPVTASLSGNWNAWPDLYTSDAIDLAQVHVYGPWQDLDQGILEAVSTVAASGKPVLLGESGLDWHPPAGTVTLAPEGPIGTRHAAWAALVAGALDCRALWWEDSHVLEDPDFDGRSFLASYPAVEAPVLELVGSLDMAGMKPLDVRLDLDLLGGVLGREGMAIGWVRTTACSSQGNWLCDAPSLGTRLWIWMPGPSGALRLTFHDPRTGAALGAPVPIAHTSGEPLEVALPDFTDDVVFTLDASE